MITMSMALVALSTPLAAQSRAALLLGYAGTLGGGWQVEAADIGYARSVRAGPLRVASVGARVGSFMDEGAIIGGARGFVFGVTLGGQTGLWTLAELGNETGANAVGVDFTIEATGYLGTRSPLSVGSPWGAVTTLPGLRFGSPDGARFGLLVGPTFFFGDVGDVRPFLGLRFEAPLARRERDP